MNYVIKKGNKFVARPGRKNAYTNTLTCARVFETKEQAEKDCCGNEIIVKITDCINKW